jgi:histidine triad (HIT) family protein
MTASCIFCSIAAKAIPAEVVYDDAHAMAFLDQEPRTLGHTLVIPKAHGPTIVDIPEEVVGPLFLAVRRVAAMLTKSLAADGLTIGINQGAVSGQAVGHLHVHLFPRFTGDGGGSVHSVVHVPSNEPLSRVAERIRGVTGVA